ncbi:universal stress protein [Nocardioides sp. SYSU DS0651]|uniref:universal stress protein n=1 Tax=Nocardioides sp. SYSU DS0651 TaxID=3415955 RepID=UPI003F4C6B4C
MNTNPIPSGSVLVAVDGSDHAARAVAWAAEEAALEHRPVTVVSVGEEGRPALREATETIERLAPGVAVHTVAATGDPRGVLVDMSRDAHLLVLGSRGRGAVRSILLGSVSAAVSKYAYCPLVVCRPVDRTDAGDGVLVGADGSPESLPVIEFAFRQASMRGLPLTVVHCVWDALAAVAGMRNIAVEELDPAAVEDIHLLLAESVAGFTEKYPEVEVSRRVAHGLVDEVLAAGASAWDLVVVGRHPIDSLGRVVTGSIATAVVERARTTVAVVPEAAGRDWA